MKTELTNIVALDDDVNFLNDLKISLGDQFLIRLTTTVPEALKALSQYRPDVLLLDMNMPEINGIQFLKVVKQRMPDMIVLMLTGDTRAEMIVNAIKSGAFDYIVKGSEDFTETLKFRINQAVALNGAKKSNELLIKKIREEESQFEILGISAATIRLKNQILKFKNSDAYVLILGENGTGKELIARTLNIQENNPSRPFVAVNCGAIPVNLFESELFGHVKGAFTGATDQPGKFVTANGGDIFLDEIGELPLDMQVKLLRVLQEKVVTPVGSNKPIKVNVRVIAATNRKLEDLVRSGKFREDLFYRLNALTITSPSLRDRPEDIIYLATAFAEKKFPGIKISKEAISILENHRWPGNIRELQNTIERACILVRESGVKIYPEHLSIVNIQTTQVLAMPSDLMPSDSSEISEEKFQDCMDWIQKTFLERALSLLGGNNNILIDRLGMARAVYYRRKKKLGIGDENDPRLM